MDCLEALGGLGPAISISAAMMMGKVEGGAAVSIAVWAWALFCSPWLQSSLSLRAEASISARAAARADRQPAPGAAACRG